MFLREQPFIKIALNAIKNWFCVSQKTFYENLPFIIRHGLIHREVLIPRPIVEEMSMGLKDRLKSKNTLFMFIKHYLPKIVGDNRSIDERIDEIIDDKRALDERIDASEGWLEREPFSIHTIYGLNDNNIIGLIEGNGCSWIFNPEASYLRWILTGDYEPF